MTGARALCLAALVCAGCRGDRAPVAVSAPSDASPVRARAEPVPRVGPQRRGVPHAGAIDLIAVTRDGTAAVSRDHLGGVRLWPALDGSREPLLLPLRGAEDLAVEVGRGPGGERELRVAALGGAARLRAFIVAADGSVRELPAPTMQVGGRDLELLPGGELALVVGGDHRLLLVGVDGRVRAQLEARQFRPERVLLDETGTRALAIERSGTGAVAHRLAVDAEKLALRRVGEPIELALAADIARGQVALSPGGARVAYFVRPREDQTPDLGTVAIVELGSGERREVEAGLPASGRRALGFVDDDTVVAAAEPSGGSWRIDATSGQAVAITGPADQARQGGADAFAPDLRVSADGSWLHVARAGEAPLYLGYASFQPQAAALSPGGEHAAWVNADGMVYVVSTADGAVVQLERLPRDPLRYLAFVDPEHLVTATATGALTLLHWPSRTTVATADVGDSVAELGADPARRLVRASRIQKRGAVVFEVGRRGFSAARVIADGSHMSGFLPGDEHLWTLDHRNVLRRYQLSELREGLSHPAARDRGLQVGASAPSMSIRAVDDRGRVYGIVRRGGPVEIYRQTPGDAAAALVFETTPSPMHVVPGPGGARVAVSDSSGLLSVYDGASGERLWLRSFGQGGPGTLTWSADGRRLLASSVIGAMVLDAGSGEAVYTTCGPHFEARPTAPQLTLLFTDRPNLCEL